MNNRISKELLVLPGRSQTVRMPTKKCYAVKTAVNGRQLVYALAPDTRPNRPEDYPLLLLLTYFDSPDLPAVDTTMNLDRVCSYSVHVIRDTGLQSAGLICPFRG